MGAERQVQQCVKLKNLGNNGKEFSKKGFRSCPTFFDVLPASFRIPHSFTLTWASDFHQSEESTLICLKTGSWKGDEAPSGFLADSPCRLPTSKAVWGPATVGSSSGSLVRSGEDCALFLNPESRGELDLRVESRVPVGNSDVTVKFATVHSWVPHLTAEA